MHQGAPECTGGHFAGLDAPESAPGCSISAPECRCGKALEALRGKVAEAIVALDDGRVEAAQLLMRDVLANAAPKAGP